MPDAVAPPVLPRRRVGRYALYDEIGHGGTASVHLGRLWGAANFSRTVAIKQMHAHVGRDAAVSAMFLDEARLSSRIAHPSVVPIHDLVAIDGDLFLVMDYVVGESLAILLHRQHGESEALDSKLAVRITIDALAGLHAAHEATDERGVPLGLVHRDVSPHNLLVGIDGHTRVLDFGIAKATGRLQETNTGQVKGKISYMAPEQLLGQELDRRVDVFAAGIVLWECLAGRKLFSADSPGEAVQRILEARIPSLSEFRSDVPRALEAVVFRALARDPKERFATAAAFADALVQASPTVSAESLGAWVERRAGEALAQRLERLRAIEAGGPPPEGRFVAVVPRSVPVDGANGTLGDETVSFVGTGSFGLHDDTPSPVAEENVRIAAKPKRASRYFLLGAAVLALCAVLGARFGLITGGRNERSNARLVERAPQGALSKAPTNEGPAVTPAPQVEKIPLPKSPEPASSDKRAPAKAKVTKPVTSAPAASAGKRAEDLFSRN